MSQSGGEPQNLKLGSNVGLSFDLPPVLGSPYGSADKLSGVIPFILPYGEYVVPSIFQDTDRLKAFSDQMAIKYRDCFPNLLDETIRERIMDSTVCGSLMYPDRDVTEEGMKSYAIVSCLAFVMDDFIDEADFDTGVQYVQSKPAINMIKDILSGMYARREDVPCPFEAAAPIMRIVWDFYEEGIKEIKDMKENFTYLSYEMRNTISSSLLRKERGVHSKFSDDVNNIMRGYLHALTVVLEFIVLHQNIQVSEEIRNDMLFQQMKQALNVATYIINDLFGLTRDIERDQVEDSSILTKVVDNGIPLQTAFDNALASVNGNVRDFKIAAKLLREFYYDDPNVSKYIRVSELFFDGLMNGYLRATRYGKNNVKIVPIID